MLKSGINPGFLSLSTILSAFGGVCACGLFSRLVKDISSDKVRQELRTQTTYPISSSETQGHCSAKVALQRVCILEQRSSVLILYTKTAHFGWEHAVQFIFFHLDLSINIMQSLLEFFMQTMYIARSERETNIHDSSFFLSAFQKH